MRVLVTGVTGQIGGALVSRLAGEHELIAAARDSLDLSVPAAIAGRLDELAPELIINPAAYTAVDRAEDEHDLAFRINAEAPGAIARWAAERRVPLIHFSTDYVYDGSGTRPWREDDPTGPLSVYGASKLAGEDAVRATSAPHLIVRTSWVYAARGANFLRTIARLARERAELRVVADQIGAPTSAQLIADAVAAILALPGTSLADRFAAVDGLVNLSASGETSWHAFAVVIIEGLRARDVRLAAERVASITTAEYPTKATRPANSRLDLTRLAKGFNITTARWNVALATELDRLVRELSKTN